MDKKRSSDILSQLDGEPTPSIHYRRLDLDIPTPVSIDSGLKVYGRYACNEDGYAYFDTGLDIHIPKNCYILVQPLISSAPGYIHYVEDVELSDDGRYIVYPNFQVHIPDHVQYDLMDKFNEDTQPIVLLLPISFSHIDIKQLQ